MFKSVYNLLSLFDNVEKIHGRKKVQKMIHLFEISGVELSFKYEYHHFGPYSAELQAELNFLVNQGLLDETKAEGAYVYAITDKGKEFKEKLQAEEEYQIYFDDGLLHEFMSKSSQFLEVVSTYAYLLDLGYDHEYAKANTLQLKAHLEGYVEEAIQFYNENIVC